MEEIDKNQLEFIETLSQKILSLLPNRTGHSIAEVEVNAQFIVTKKVILQNLHSYPLIISYVLLSFANSLEKINQESHSLKFKDRSERSLASTLIICKLLSDILKRNWNRENTYYTLERNDLSSNYSKFCYFDQPHEIESSIVEQLIDTFVSLLSPGVIKKVLNLVKNLPSPSSGSPPQKDQELSSITNSADGSIPLNPLNSHIDSIDNHVGHILRYIAAANPREYCGYIHDKVFVYSTNQTVIPLPALQKYAPLFKFAFYIDGVCQLVAAELYGAIPYIKSSSWRQVFLVFATSGVQDQCFSRPMDYENIISNASPEYQRHCQLLFDSAIAAFDDTLLSNPCSSFAATWLLMLCLDDFKELEIVRSKNLLRPIRNKRVKFLLNVIKDANNCANLESFDCLIKLFHLGARLASCNLYEHPILKFCYCFLDSTYDSLCRFKLNPSNFTDPETYPKFDLLSINFYTAALLLKREKFIEVVTQRFKESQGNIKEVSVIAKICCELPETEIGKEVLGSLMKKLAKPFKSIIFGTIKILKQYNLQQAHLQGAIIIHPESSSSSAASIHSDMISIELESGQFANSTNLALNLYKTSLDHYVTDLLNTTSTSDTPDDSSITNLLIPQTSHSHTAQHTSQKSQSSSINSYNSGPYFKDRYMLAEKAEELLADILHTFIAMPELYFNDDVLMSDLNLKSVPRNEMLKRIVAFSEEVSLPLKYSFGIRGFKGSESPVFDAACSLAMTLVDKHTLVATNYTTLSTVGNYVASNLIVQSICEACLLLSLTDSRFKSCILLINKFLEGREQFKAIVAENRILSDPSSAKYIDFGSSSCHAIEKVLLLSLCTHDIQFYNIAKTTMKWYCNEFGSSGNSANNLTATFERVLHEDSVFTGFVSLHKRFRSILRDANPTKSLYQIWLGIYNRWLELLEVKSILNDENLVFRHFTGFLVSTAGCFLSETFSPEDVAQNPKAYGVISEFFDKCIGLLTSSDLVVRVVIKDALSNESHSSVYHLVTLKIVNVANNFSEKKIVSEEAVMFIEQSLMIFTAMSGVENDGAFLLVALIPTICQLFIKFLSLVDNKVDTLRIKLRFCKMVEKLESEKERNAITGAFKLRNFYAKASAEWLEQAVFYEPDEKTYNSNEEQEIAYLNIDLAAQSSKALSMQLERNPLELPEGTKDTEVKKYKDLAFGNYFSLFYKIIQKYSTENSNHKSKYKLNTIIDNVLKCISNILQFDADIGMQFVLPLGYHQNKKIRSIFLNVFANMLASRKSRVVIEEYPESMINKLTSITDIYGAIAEVASSTEHNLLASSLFGIFSYTRKLDELFKVLLNDEINNVSRSSDIFRRNSTLTRLLSNFANDNGVEYLRKTLEPFLEELVEKSPICEVERGEPIEEDIEIFMKYFNRLVDLILDSVDSIPNSFKFICSEIYKCVKKKFEDAALIAVGSFLFLRFLCPAIISPEKFFKIEITNPKVKRTLMQLVKVIQNIANGSLSSLKWPGLCLKTDELNEANRKIFELLALVSTDRIKEYPFQAIEQKPIPELRYLHKFIYTYIVAIKVQFTSSETVTDLHERVQAFRSLDKIAFEMGNPKFALQLQIQTSYKNYDPSNNANNQFNDFMARMSMNFVSNGLDCNLIHNSIFNDGTPVVVVNLKKLTEVGSDVTFLVYKLFETASQVWDNKFYLVFDFTEMFFTDKMIKQYRLLLEAHGPDQLFKNCPRIYYFNIPRNRYKSLVLAMALLRLGRAGETSRIYVHSQADGPEVVNNLCLDPVTISITRDTRVIFNNAKLYDSALKTFTSVNIRMGRKWLQVCSEEKVVLQGANCDVSDFIPVDIYRLAEIYKCEVSSITGHEDEFTILLNTGETVTLRSHERLEILRFLYFTTSRLPKLSNYSDIDKENEHSERSMHWFGRLYNIVFQALLCKDEEVKSSGALLFGALSSYFDIDLGIKLKHATTIAFPVNTNEFVVSVSEHLAFKFPYMSYRFFKAFFDNYDKLPEHNKLSAITYISPWIENIYENIYLESTFDGPDKTADLVRQFCRISATNKDNIAFLNDYIWKKMFNETRLITILVDEVVAFAIDNRNDGPDWSFIIAVISPSVEVCGEVIDRLISCVNKAKKDDSEIASQSKLFEIKILIKICASLFFNSYTFSRFYLADVFFLATLFIDNVYLDFGADLQKLFINLIQSFSYKPGLTAEEHEIVDNTIKYFSGQRAKMLFGMTRDFASTGSDGVQLYNRASSFEILCEYLDEFIDALGASAEKSTWKSRWCSNAFDVAFKMDSIFQSRAILVVGIVSMKGINDSTASKIMKLISKSECNDLEFTTCLSISTSRIIQGLEPSSTLASVLVWPILCFSLMHISELYQSSILCLLQSVTKLVAGNPAYVEKAFEHRKLLEPFVSEFERRRDLRITPGNFCVHIFFVFSQGLKVSQLKHTSLKCMKHFYAQRSKFDDVLSSSHLITAYLMFIYLSLDDHAFEEYANSIDVKVEYIEVSPTERIPKDLITFICEGNDASKVALILAAYFYDSPSVDNTFKTRFLTLYRYLFEFEPEVGLFVFHIMKAPLVQDMINSNNDEVFESIAKILANVARNKEYSHEAYEARANHILSYNDLLTIRDIREMNVDENISVPGALSKYIGPEMKTLQAMVYRSACLYVEGTNLED